MTEKEQTTLRLSAEEVRRVLKYIKSLDVMLNTDDIVLIEKKEKIETYIKKRKDSWISPPLYFIRVLFKNGNVVEKRFHIRKDRDDSFSKLIQEIV